MNLGDGLKLETELLDGKTKLILSPSEHKSKLSVKMGNKAKIVKCSLRPKQNGHILKSTQNTCIGSKTLLQKQRTGSETSLAKGEKSSMTFSPTEDFCKQYADKDYLHLRKEISPATPNTQKTRNTVNKAVLVKQKSCKEHIDNSMESGLVFLTQDQLQQILMTINQGRRSTSLTENGKEETSQYSQRLNNIPDQPKDENIMGLLQKTEAVSSNRDENKSAFLKNEIIKENEQKIIIENVWKPADIFSALGERERDRSLLEAKKAQWRKELDEQVALKKKEKEASEKWNNPWKKVENDKIVWEKYPVVDCNKSSCSSSSILSQTPYQVTMVQTDGRSLPRASQILEGEPERWAIHFDSLKNYPDSRSQLSSRSTHKQPEYLCVSPDTQELTDISSVYTPATESQVEPSEEENCTRPAKDLVLNSQKTNFLRSMTALLDPAQIEERDRRRQKQLEHQKAIAAQVEEKRRKKQLEEEQRRKEEQEEERRLAREREEMQRQYEEDMLKQKQKEEIMTLKTNELFRTMQQAQDLAQRLKREQRIRELSQKGHDTSGLLKNLGVDTAQLEWNTSTILSDSSHGLNEVSGQINTYINPRTSPKKDTGVQTEDLSTGICANAESHCGSVRERETRSSSSPEIPAEFNEQFNINGIKEEAVSQDKETNLEKENSWSNERQVTRAEKQMKHLRKCPKRPDWNINKPLKRYIPASEKYPKELQKQREEKKVRRQMKLLHLLERNYPGHLCQNRDISPVDLHSPHQETEFRWQLMRQEESLKSNLVSKERSQSPPISAVKSKIQQTLKNNYERENLTSGHSQTESSHGTFEPLYFIPYVRTNEIYYLDPDEPLSRPASQEPQHQNPHNCDQEPQLFDHVRDPLLNPNLVKNRDRQQAILKGLSELRQGLLQKQRELETNLMPLVLSQEENFSSLS